MWPAVGTKIGIEFATTKLLDYAADEAALDVDRNPFGVVALAHLKTLETAHDLVWTEVREFAKEKNMPRLTGAELVGREEGLAEGLAQAREGFWAGIEELLDLRFGASGLALLAEIRSIEDLDLLRKILHSIKQAESPQGLRRLWSNG